MKHRHFPRYNDDADFTTNAPSYYEDLARKEKLIRLLAERIWGYEKIVDETLEQIQERFRAWDKNLEDLPEGVKVLLQKWLDNGTLDHIINDTIFNWKLDTSIFEQFRDTITAQLQQNEKKWKQVHVNVKDFGAKGDGVTDDTLAIQNAIDSLGAGGGVAYFPDGYYLLKETVFVGNKTLLLGYNRKRTVMVNSDGSSTYNVQKPMIASRNYDKNAFNEDISIHEISFQSKGERTAYTVELNNTITAQVTNCVFGESGFSSKGSKHGLGILRKAGYGGSFYLAKVEHSRFSRSVLHIEATDSYITNNELWGNERERALYLYNASNSIIHGNQIVGGSVYGGIHIGANGIGLKITSNYFDGSYFELDTSWGINSTSKSFERSVIANNNFWRQKGGGIKANNMNNTQITGNVFDDCDLYDNGQSDIELGVTSDPVWGVHSNYISNTHYRSKKLNNEKTALIDRSTLNPTPVMRIHNLSGAPTIINEPVISYKQYYGVAELTGSVQPKGGNYPELITPVGYENSYRKTTGTGTIPIGQTTVFITHNLGYIPRGSDIHLTMMSPLFNAKGLFIQNMTTNGFTVKADVPTGDTLSGEVSFSYEIVKQR